MNEPERPMASNYQVFFKTPDTVVGPVCLPAAWKREDVRFFLSKYLARSDALIDFQDDCDPQLISCDDTSHRLYLSILIAWITIIIAAQFHGRRECRSTISKLISCLSIRDNFATLTQDASDKMDFFYGFRIIFLLYSVYCHSFQSSILFAPLAMMNGAKYDSPLLFKLIETQWINGMTFNFVWAAFLGFRSRVGKSLTSREIVSQLISRCLRTLPTVLGCYLIILSMPRSFGSGPLWNSGVTKWRTDCLAGFWSEITYTQYLINPFDYCIGPSWILGPDLHFFLIGMVIMIIYKWKRFPAIILILIMIPLGVISQVAFLTLNQYPGLVDMTKFDESIIRKGYNMHTRSLNYVSSYMLGLLAAIVSHEKLSVSRRLREISIISGIAVLSLEVWRVSWNWHILGRPEEVVFVVLHKTVSAVFCSSITALIYQYSCCNEKSILVSLLSCKLFRFIGKFNFSIYLAHMLFIYYEMLSVTQPVNYSILQFFMRTIYITAASIPFGVIVFLLFEGPSAALAKLVSQAIKTTSQKKSS